MLVSAVKKVNQLYDHIYPLFLRFPFHLEGFSIGLVVKNPTANAVDVGLIPGSRRSSGEGNGNPFSIFAWEIPWTEDLEGYSPWGRKRVRHFSSVQLLSHV